MTDPLQPYFDSLGARPCLSTPRLLLRRPEAHDIPALVTMLDDWEMARRLARIPHPYTMADARFFLEEVVPAELVWAIVDRASGAMVGVIGLAPCGAAADALEIGYYVARAHWGQGIATEAGSAVIAFAAGLVGHHRLRSGHFADNAASGRVLRKLGFVEAGRSTRHCLATDQVVPSVELRHAGA